MLFLLFRIGGDRYALEAGRVVEVVPMLQLKRLPQALPGVAGLFNFRGQTVPVVDLSALTIGVPAAEHLSTRIIIINHESPGGKLHPVGLIAERATETLRCDSHSFINAGARAGATACLGPVLEDERGSILWLYEERLLPEQLTRQLFSTTSPLP